MKNKTVDEKGIICSNNLQKIMDECGEIISYYNLSESISKKSYKCNKVNDEFMKVNDNLLGNPCRLPMVYTPKKGKINHKEVI
jgi:hypothetical protein